MQDDAEKPKAGAEVKQEEAKVVPGEDAEKKEEKEEETEKPKEEAEEKALEEILEKAPEEIKDLEDIKKDIAQDIKETKEDDEAVQKVEPEKNGDLTPEKKSPEKASLQKTAKPGRMIDVEEYLVKFKNFSYLHCQWLTEQELTRGDKRINNKIKRFQQKREKSGNVLDFCEEEPFNPDYVEVDRVLDSSEHTDEVSKVSRNQALEAEKEMGWQLDG